MCLFVCGLYLVVVQEVSSSVRVDAIFVWAFVSRGCVSDGWKKGAKMTYAYAIEGSMVGF